MNCFPAPWDVNQWLVCFFSVHLGEHACLNCMNAPKGKAKRLLAAELWPLLIELKRRLREAAAQTVVIGPF